MLERFISSTAPSLLTTVICFALIGAACWKLRRTDAAAARTILNLAALYAIAVVLGAINVFGRDSIYRDAFDVPFIVVRRVIEIVAALVIFRTYALGASEPHSKSNGEPQVDVELQVERILDSKHFLTALRSTLPKGREDANNGLDYIPFLLHNMQERQKMFAKRARYCLLATVTLGIVFSGMVTYFGYILVNEAGAGTAKVVSELRADVRSVANDLGLLQPGYYVNQAFQRDVAPAITTVQQLFPGKGNETLEGTVRQAIEQAQKTDDPRALLRSMVAVKSQVSDQTEDGRRYAVALDNLTDKLQTFLALQDGAMAQLSTSVKDVTQVVAKVEERLAKPENQTAEILKRLAIGLAVASFFIVILRYTTGLYRMNYGQELKTMYDDDATRRFYVGYKSSADNEEQRKVVLTAFMAATAPTGTSSMSDTTSATSEEMGLLKEIVATLAKKL